MIKISLVDDHSVVRNGIRLILDSKDEFEILNEANDGLEILELLKTGEEPDIVLADINMPLMNGLELTTVLAQTHPEIKVILLSMLGSTEYISQAFQSGARGYLVKNISCDELVTALLHVSKGGRYVCEELSLGMLDVISNQQVNFKANVQMEKELDLSDRETEVLQLISEGYTNLEIAEKLFLSKRTVEGHRQNLIQKTKVKNSAALIKFAVRNNLVV